LTNNFAFVAKTKVSQGNKKRAKYLFMNQISVKISAPNWKIKVKEWSWLISTRYVAIHLKTLRYTT